jgi:hypothetical protein
MAERVAPRVEELLAVPWDRSSRARVRDPELGRHPHEVGERLGLHLLHEVIVEARWHTHPDGNRNEATRARRLPSDGTRVVCHSVVA